MVWRVLPEPRRKQKQRPRKICSDGDEGSGTVASRLLNDDDQTGKVPVLAVSAVKDLARESPPIRESLEETTGACDAPDEAHRVSSRTLGSWSLSTPVCAFCCFELADETCWVADKRTLARSSPGFRRCLRITACSRWSSTVEVLEGPGKPPATAEAGAVVVPVMRSAEVRVVESAP